MLFSDSDLSQASRDQVGFDSTKTGFSQSVNNFVQDVKGDLATNTIGAIIVAVVIIGILVLAVNTFFPSFFTDMFSAMKDKLNANW